MQSCSAAILDDQQTLAKIMESRERGHAERLAPLVSEALQAANIGVVDLSRIVVTIGPGSFTGVRVGLAFARGLTVGRDLPVVGITTLQALAATYSSQVSEQKVVLIDARRGQVYGQIFDQSNEPRDAAFVLSPDEVRNSLPDLDKLAKHQLIGSGVPLVFPDLVEKEDWRAHQPDPVAIAQLGAKLPDMDVAPSAMYLRAADAKPASVSPVARSVGG
ncbi:MAG: tRNA (adenosine(37)-N6)-threonylcarbamoyltransferase complex dimerization subunit type 1 TsaB [Aquisalinus sp.]|nr:tRNA (adenosine(37)-N6)-threonylcarbamoyltransferase complex dimerization subunit type 1 TsaB [Aquisalinus sp.]